MDESLEKAHRLALKRAESVYYKCMKKRSAAYKHEIDEAFERMMNSADALDNAGIVLRNGIKSNLESWRYFNQKKD